MTDPIHIEETTYRDMASVLFPNSHQHSKLARSVVEYLIGELGYKGSESVGGHADLETLRRFVSFLITKKNYN